MELISRQAAIDVVAKTYRYESDRITALQELPTCETNEWILGNDINSVKIIAWQPMTQAPKTSGYILLAIKHNNLNDVVMGHYSRHRGFQCATYPQGVNTQFCYWAYMPEHPDGEEWKR